jgi:hypothetical protein
MNLKEEIDMEQMSYVWFLERERERDNCKREEWRPGEDMDGESPVRDGRGKD